MTVEHPVNNPISKPENSAHHPIGGTLAHGPKVPSDKKEPADSDRETREDKSEQPTPADRK